MLSIVYRHVSELRPDSENARIHSPGQIKQIVRSIETFGFNVPVLVNGRGQIIAGHGRVQAAELLGIATVPTIRLSHLTEQQIRAFMIADNRLTENSQWDQELLRNQLQILSEAELDFSVEVTGFHMAEIDLMLENLSPAEAAPRDSADVIPDSSAVPVTKAGDLWLLGKHRVSCGDALNRLNFKTLMGDRRAHAVFTDPPYNLRIAGNVSGNGKKCHREFAMASGEMDKAEFTRFLGTIFKHLAAFSLPGSLHYVCMDWRHMKELLAAGHSTYSELKNVCVWVKHNAGMGSFYRSQREMVFVFKHGASAHRNNIQLGQFGRSRSNVWHYPGANTFSRSSREGDLLALHPTVKPVSMVADAIMDCSSRGDLVVDPFLGSGTTAIAAERTGRICYGMELDTAYVDTVIRRWQKFTNLEAIHQASGQTFAHREEENGNAKETGERVRCRIRQTTNTASISQRCIRQSERQT